MNRCNILTSDRDGLHDRMACARVPRGFIMSVKYLKAVGWSQESMIHCGEGMGLCVTRVDNGDNRTNFTNAWYFFGKLLFPRYNKDL